MIYRRKLAMAIAINLVIAFLPVIMASPASSSPADLALGYKKFVVYYGIYKNNQGQITPDLDRIANARPELVISPYYTLSGQVNLVPEVMKRFHDNGIKVIAYVSTANSGRDINSVLQEIKAGFLAGTDGVMLDEVPRLDSDIQFNYYERIYVYVKSFGDKTVIANPGSILVSERIMSVSDIVSFEHQWRLAPSLDWFSKYTANRFMGISSNNIPGVMGYYVDQNKAASDTIEAWQDGIGYHYSTDIFTGLPSWFEAYQGALKGFGNPEQLQDVKVKTVDTSGQQITGLWIQVTRDDGTGGAFVTSGFSPAQFMLPSGKYNFLASNYQNFIFSNWQGSSSSEFNITNSTELVAVYKNELAALTVQSFDNTGNSVRGIYVSVIKDGKVVMDGFTPLQINLPLGDYEVAVSSYQYYQFSHWDDGSSQNPRPISLTHDTVLNAYHTNTLANIIGEQISGNTSCHDPQNYRIGVTNAWLNEGALGALVELSKQKSAMLIDCNLQPNGTK
jgi:hypothetical protein